MSVNIAIVGLGQVAAAHLEAYSHSTEFTVVAAVEPVEERLGELAGKYGFHAYTDLSTMMRRENPDIVCVLTPVNLHRKIVEYCVARGAHIFCEKPLAANVDDAEKIVSACKKYGLRLCYGSSYRYLPAVIKAREIIQSGGLGEVLLMTESVLGGSGEGNHDVMSFDHYPAGGPGGSGMGLVDHGIHLIDVFPWLTGSDVVSVFGKGNVSGNAPVTEYACMNLSNGATVQLIYNDSTFGSELPAEGIFSHGAAWNVDGFDRENTWHDHPGSMHVYGSSGALRIFHYGSLLYLRDKTGIREIRTAANEPPAHFAAQMESFVRSIKAGARPAVDGDDGVTALRVLEAIYESARNGRLVNIDGSDPATGT